MISLNGEKWLDYKLRKVLLDVGFSSWRLKEFLRFKNRIWGKARSSSLSIPKSLKRLKVKRIIEVILKLFSFVLGATHLSHVQFM